MEFRALTFWCAFVLAASGDAAGNKLLPGMPNVCAEREVTMVGQWQPRIQAFTRLVQARKPGCAGHPWCVNYERRVMYFVDNRQVYGMQYQTVYRCCPGWSQLGESAGCVYPVCSYGVCLNGGKCAEGTSQVCHCPSGFQGPCCQYDVNECDTGNAGCESQCCNTIGSFYCRCPQGSKLRDDGKTCEGKRRVHRTNGRLPSGLARILTTELFCFTSDCKEDAVPPNLKLLPKEENTVALILRRPRTHN